MSVKRTLDGASYGDAVVLGTMLAFVLILAWVMIRL